MAVPHLPRPADIRQQGQRHLLLKKSVGGVLDVTATVPAGSTTLWDKTAADIQSDLTIGEDDVIRGTSKHVATWATPGFDPSKGTNYIAIHLKAKAGDTLTVECIPSQGTPTASFTDDDAVLQITADTVGIKVNRTRDGVVTSESYGLDVTLETE